MNRLRTSLLLGALLLPVSCQSPEGKRVEAHAARDLEIARVARRNAEAINELRAELAELRAQLQVATMGQVEHLERAQQFEAVQEIARLKEALAEARRSYTDQHPEVVALQRGIDEAALRLPADLRREVLGEEE